MQRSSRGTVGWVGLLLLVGACGGSEATSGDGPADEPPVCGDGKVQTGEACDDGAANSDTAPDACRSDCSEPSCGDGVIDLGEQCDNGAANDDAAADACRTTCMVARCGDGVLDSGEACDDGNLTPGDGCSDICTLHACGNGVLDAGEECDDGNLDSQDACLNNCLFAQCGDGIRRTDITDNTDPAFEACDDGDLDLSDDCPDGPGGTCRTAYCGDGFTDLEGPAVEACDDANGDDSDACTSRCEVAACGDGFLRTDIIDPSDPAYEACDEGPLNSDLVADACRTSCQLPACGDGVADSGEGCDDGNNDTADACPDGAAGSCQPASCGDGFTQAGVEQCDNGAANASDADCMPGCLVNRCGDGILNTVGPNNIEGCDDGNGQVTDDCPDGPSGSCQPATCGDGYVNRLGRSAGGGPPEQCDDGPSGSAVCTNTCTVVLSCGNGVVETGEECDDGRLNADASDACRTTCESPRCGDGIIDFGLGEQCDDLNLTAGDGCGPDCRVEPPASCGDGVVDEASGEQCDPPDADFSTCMGSATPSACCDASCRFATVGASCGDAVLDPGELCDDGGLANGDGCNPTCNLRGQVSMFADWVDNGAGNLVFIGGNGHIVAGDRYLWLAPGGWHQIIRVELTDACLSDSTQCLFEIVAGNGALLGTGLPGNVDDPNGQLDQVGWVESMATDGRTLWFSGPQTIRAVQEIDNPALAPDYPVTTVMGTIGSCGTSDGIGAAVLSRDIRGLVYYDSYIYFVDSAVTSLRRFDPITGRVITLAGAPYMPADTNCITARPGTQPTVPGYGLNAIFSSPRYTASNNAGLLFVTDTNGETLCTYNLLSGYVDVLVGSGTVGYADQIGTAAQLDRPRGLTSDGTSVYWAEQVASTVRQAEVANRQASTLAGVRGCSGSQPGIGGTGVDQSASCVPLRDPNWPLFGGPVGGAGVWRVTFHYRSNSLFVLDGSGVRRVQ